MLSKLKGLDKIEEILNRFLQEWECTVRLESDFAYYYYSNTIAYSFCCSNVGDMLFSEVINRLCPEIHCDIFLWSFLHELGHHETYDDLEDSDVLFSLDEKERIQKEQEGITDVKQRMDIARQYYVLPDELAATQWAVDYMRAHTAEMQALWEEELKPAIINFYELNKVEVA